MGNTQCCGNRKLPMVRNSIADDVVADTNNDGQPPKEESKDHNPDPPAKPTEAIPNPDIVQPAEAAEPSSHGEAPPRPPPPPGAIPPPPAGVPPPPMNGVPPPPLMNLPPPPNMGGSGTKHTSRTYRNVPVEKLQMVRGMKESVWPSTPGTPLRSDEKFDSWIKDNFRLQNGRNKSSRHGGRAQKEDIDTKVITLQRRQNISIPLKIMDITPDEIVKSIESTDPKVLTEENLQRIQTMMPTDKELKDINRVIATIAQKKFRRANEIGERVLKMLPGEEQLMVKLAQIPNFRERIHLLRFCHSFGADYARTSAMLDTIRFAVAKVEHAAHKGKFRRILKNVLRVINMLNESDEKGFRISTLTKLSSTKMTTGKGSLMDVIVMHSTTVDKEKCEGFEEEISGLEPTCSLEYNEIKVCLRTCEEVIKNIRSNR